MSKDDAAPTADGTTNEAIQIDANVIRQLGDQLISDSEQALLELIKNSYDADASWSRIEIDTTYVPPKEIGAAPGARGRLVITDDGSGMDINAIRNGWLTISLSPKREMKRKGLRTRKFQRTPLGDKGLGRLGTMKLGEILKIETFYSDRAPGNSVTIRWNRFQPGELLSRVQVPRSELPAEAPGTRITIYGLADREYWRGEERIKSLQQEMSTLVSPFEEFHNFKVSIQVDGKSVELQTLSRDLRETASVQFQFDWDDKRLYCTGRVKLGMFRARKDDDAFDRSVLTDGGAALWRLLKSLPRADSFELKRSTTRGWYVEFNSSWNWKEVVNLPGHSQFEKPGPFHGELDSFDLDTTTPDQDEFFSNRTEYREFVKRESGVKVYRDGFAVRLGDDWLGLGKAWTSGRSYYGLKPSNTLGFVAISADRNPRLTEKSDREGFIDTPASDAFFYLLRDVFVKFTHDALTFLRRGYLKFQEAEKARIAKLPPSWDPADAASRLREVAEQAHERQRAISASDQRWTTGLARLERQIGESGGATPKDRQRLAGALDEVKKITSEWSAMRRTLTAELDVLREEEKLAESILERFAVLRNQVDEVYETVGIGLAAQALSHEIYAMLDDLVARTQKVAKRTSVREDPPLAGYLEAVRATADALRKHVSFMDPMIRTARETKQVFDIGSFVREYFELRSDRLSKLNIDFKITATEGFSVRMNRGRLLQVLDNLVRNSEYWLQQYGRNHPQSALEINVELARPHIIVSDTGPGVKPQIENVIFDLFVTDKPKEQGTGLGLFIARQLLERDSCHIYLDEARNKSKRRYRFVVDLSGVLEDANRTR
jgi:signal transduction histidine kinase